MIGSPLATTTVFRVGLWEYEACRGDLGSDGRHRPWSFVATRFLSIKPAPWQAALELFLGAIEDQIRETLRTPPQPYVPFLGTLFLFILVANWSSLIPGIEPPTAHIETDAALALIVFFAVFYFGIRARGFIGFLKTFAEPSIVMIPLNIVETFTRTFSLLVRLFGNVMSGVFIVAIVLSLAGLIVPIPLMALDLLTGAVQAYIFTVLAMVFIGGAVNEVAPNAKPKTEVRLTL